MAKFITGTTSGAVPYRAFMTIIKNHLVTNGWTVDSSSGVDTSTAADYTFTMKGPDAGSIGTDIIAPPMIVFYASAGGGWGANGLFCAARITTSGPTGPAFSSNLLQIPVLRSQQQLRGGVRG